MTGYPPFPGPTGGNMYPPVPPGGSASPPGGSMYPPGPPGGSAYPPGLPDAPSSPSYQGKKIFYNLD